MICECGHEKADHEKPGKKSAHAHFSDYQHLHPRMFPTLNYGAFCKVALCDCLDFKEAGCLYQTKLQLKSTISIPGK